ncbi:Os01g0935450 [Oryza sativa Japonica Group]|uniref:Os01g0935450 protein n=1 Tax=Oryza sativa subsp. japonica TaxID=39947 RepID=A0A0P0VCL4_ORYSJ|nr:hypothetical protein EE612_007828 [Oryza sativa]BAS76088.1 Os01g0935450 [Oryza sativa Japonica Group]
MCSSSRTHSSLISTEEKLLPKVGRSCRPEVGAADEGGLDAEGEHVAPVELLVVGEDEGVAVALDAAGLHGVLLLLLQRQHEELPRRLLHLLHRLLLHSMVHNLQPIKSFPNTI